MLYLITDRRLLEIADLTPVLKALAPGSAYVQLREKDLEGRDLYALASELRASTQEWGHKLLINDRLDVALAVGADGVHLSTRSAPIAQVRAAWPDGLIGQSCHSAEEVEAASRGGADFALLGPIFETPSKSHTGFAPLGLREIEAARVRVGRHFQVIAVGGINAVSAPHCIGAGANGIAVIRAVMAHPEPADAAPSVVRSCRIS